ncbi:MAG: peroxiredoxin [SAR202 cluster bacterium Io17-Chloro-G4]|nr:MAG: peroxiredoxin [SAR202 cluster bacterium Io17-Chloro-G4]
MAVEVGQAAPEFSLYDMDRTQRSLSEYKGKNVVLAFVPGAFTGTCTTEMCDLRDQVDQFNSMNVEVLGISVDPPFSQKAWAEANNLNFTMLSDFSRQATHAYDVAWNNMAGLEGYTASNRAVFVLDKEGVVRYKWLAPSPADLPNYDEIRQAISNLS